MKEPMSDQIIKQSAFDGKQEATTVVFEWIELCLIDEDGLIDSAVRSSTFGTAKTLFYLTAELKDMDEDFSFEKDADNVLENFSLKICLKMDKKSIKKKVFIYSIQTECSENNGKSKYKNKVLTTGTPFELMEIYELDDIILSIRVRITFRESEDSWNLGCNFSPMINNAEVLCQQLANAMVSIPADVTLKTMTDERLFPAHKLILKLRSSVFAAMFSGEFVENQTKKPIKIFEISGQVMEAMLAYIYCRSFDGWKEIAGELAMAADMYDIEPLYKLCTGFLGFKITVNTAVNNFCYADLLNLTREKLNIARFIVKRKEKIEKTESWKEITEERRDWLEKQLSELIPQNEDKNKDEKNKGEKDKDEKDKNKKDKDEEAKEEKEKVISGLLIS